MAVFGVLFFALILSAGSQAFQWTDELQREAGPIQVCSGEDIQLLWNFTLDSGERVKAMVWGCHPEGKQESVLATFADRHFVPRAPYSGRLAHLKDGGLEVSCATIQESGSYSVKVSTEDENNNLTVHRKTADVQVVDTPKTQNGEIYVTKNSEAVRDVTTGTFHVALSCGNFSDRGHPPIDVLWTTPRGERESSSGFQDGVFHLHVDNPPVGGNYCCAVPPSHPAVRCLPPKSPLLNTACVHLAETEARFALLEARYSLLEERNSLLEARDSLLESVQQDLNTTIHSKTVALESRMNKTEQDAMPVHFHAKLSSNTNLPSGSVLKLTDVISNQGGAYDPSTGMFRAPVNGSYVFLASTGSYSSKKYSHLVMEKEGTVVARIYEYLDSGGNYDMATCHAALYLMSGERVWLESRVSNAYLYSDITYFSGFRVM